MTMSPIRPELLDELLKDYEKPDDLLGQDGLLQQLTKALVERALDGELTRYSNYEKRDSSVDNFADSRHDMEQRKTLSGKRKQLQVDAPREHISELESQLVRKSRTHFDALDEKIISLYLRGMTQREIQVHLKEIYGVEVSPGLISIVTDAVLSEVSAWQSHLLDAVYPILYLDTLQVKVKSERRVSNKTICLAVGVNLQGSKEILGMWAADTDGGTKLWTQVMTELKNRGVLDIFIACVGDLKGLREAIEAVYPLTQTPLCIMHLVRHSLSYVLHRDRKQVATDLKSVFQATALEEAEQRLAQFEETWGESYPLIGKSWRLNWSGIAQMFNYPCEIRRVLCTTSAIESLNVMLRKITKSRILFTNDEAVFKLMYLVLRNIGQRWTVPVRNWSSALNQFAIIFEERVPIGWVTSSTFTQNPV